MNRSGYSTQINKGATMAEQQIPLTIEGIRAMVRDVAREAFRESGKEFDRKMDQMRAEVAEQSKETNRKISALGSRIGEIIENMVAGNIEEKFNALGYHDIDSCSPNKKFGSNDSRSSFL
jgi:hypothetical protein